MASIATLYNHNDMLANFLITCMHCTYVAFDHFIKDVASYCGFIAK